MPPTDAPPRRVAGEVEEGFAPQDRLRRRADFLRVQRRGRRVHTPCFVVVVLPHPEPGGLRRLGITVTKKVAGAVGRNRVKRVLREVFRKNRALFPEGCDIVIIAKSGSPELGYEEARQQLARVRRPLSAVARKARDEAR